MDRGGSNEGFGRGAASRAAASTGALTARSWDPTRYNVPGLATNSGPINGISALNGAGDLLWGVLQRFDQAGMITDIGVGIGNPTSGTGKATMAMYAYDGSNPMQPGALIHSFQCAGGGFNAGYSENGLTIKVKPGTGIWFVSHATQTPFVDPYNGGVQNMGPTQVDAGMGTIWIPSTPSVAVTNIIAIRKPLVYAYPPPDPFPTVALGGTVTGGHMTDLTLITGPNVPVFLFKFQPS